MTIKSEQLDQNTLLLCLSGRLDTVSSSKFELELKPFVDGTADITLDLKDLSYISSSGLHVLIQTQKAMNAGKRKLVIKNINETVRNVFEMTGFINLINQE